MFNVAMRLDADLDRWAAEAVAATGAPGISVAVCHADGLAVGAGGVLNVATGDRVTADSIFQIGSTMKVATATAVMQLVEASTVALDDPVIAYLPDLAVGDGELGEVTIRCLVDHTSGMPGNYFADFGRGDDSLDRYVRSLASQEMVHRPGAMFSYSNAGYVVAGRLLETLHHQPFRDLISDSVFSPLGLSSTTTRIEDVYGRRVAAGHAPAAEGDHAVCPDQVVGWSSVPAGSQAMSTAGELARFAQLVMNPTEAVDGVLSQASADTMARASVDLPCPYWGRSSQGLGWGVDRRDGRTVLSHGGGTTGHSALMLAVPDSGLSIVVLTNTVAGAVLNDRIDELVAEVAGLGPARSAPEANSDPATVNEAPSWTGTYADAWMIHRIEPDRDGALVLKREVLPSPLAPAGEHPPSPLHMVDEHTAVAGAERPIVFLSEGEASDQSTYLHQVSAARRIS